MQRTITELLECFSERHTAIGGELKTLADRDPEGFREEALKAIQNGSLERFTEGVRHYLAHLLVRSAGLMGWLFDPTRSDKGHAIATARVLRDAGVSLEALLDAQLKMYVHEDAAGLFVNRVLELYVALDLTANTLPIRPELSAHPDPRVRSKAAYTIARATKDTSVVARMLVGAEPRVLANAVEALWDRSGAGVTPFLLRAAGSPYARVAANGLLGLYKHGSLESIAGMFEMASDADAGRRASGIWIMGQTKDARFLPFLARRFDEAKGKEKQRVLQALSSIRRRQRSLDEAGALALSILDQRILADGSREFTFTVSAPSGETPVLEPLEVAVWEDDELALEYSLSYHPSPPLLVLGIIVPRFVSTADPYAQAVQTALQSCLDLKRPGDVWRVERYSLPDGSRDAGADQAHKVSAAAAQRDDSLLLDRQQLRKLVSDPGSRLEAAADASGAIRKMAEMTEGMVAVRQLFAFFDPGSLNKEQLNGLGEWLREECLTLYGFAPQGDGDAAFLRDLCKSTLDGSLVTTSLDKLPAVVKRTYLNLMGCYRLKYRPVSENAERSVCTVLVSSPLGCGRESMEFRNQEEQSMKSGNSASRVAS